MPIHYDTLAAKLDVPRGANEQISMANLLSCYLRRQFQASDWLRVRYKDLIAKPEATPQRICAFLNVDFEPEMLAYR